MGPIVQCAYPEKYTPLRVGQQGYPEPSHTIMHFLHNTHKSRVMVKVYGCLNHSITFVQWTT